MSAEGYEYENPDDMHENVFNDLHSRLNEIDGYPGHNDPFSGMPQEEVEQLMADKSPEELADLYMQAQAEAQAGIDQEALKELQDEERSIAVADFKCTEEISAYERFDEILARYEARFIEENRDVLNNIKNKLEE